MDFPNDLEMMNDNYLSELDPDENLLNEIYNSFHSTSPSDYFTVEKFNQVTSANENSLSMCNFNIRSYQANSETFFDFISALKMKFSIFVLTETRFSGSDGSQIDDYNGYHSGRSCLLYTSPSPRDKRQSRMPSSA